MRGGNRLVKVIKLQLRNNEITVEDVLKEKKYKMNIRYIAKGDHDINFRIPGAEERICSFGEVYEDIKRTTFSRGEISALEEKIKKAMPNVIVVQSDKIFDDYFKNKHYTVEVDFNTLKVIPTDEGAYADWGG
jgi:hypothetical protein